MKWLAFTGACVAALITLGILAVDERDVVWEGRNAFCPYCRAPVSFYAVACKECGRSFDWVSSSEECRWCLPGDVAEMLHAGLKLHKLENDPLPGPLAGFPIAWFRAMDEGSCAYCAGLGEVLSGKEEITCPVCRGRKRCIGCGGDRRVVVGDVEARRRQMERAAAYASNALASEATGLEPSRREMVDADVAELRGFAEAEEIRDGGEGSLLARGRARVREAFQALRDLSRENGKPVSPPAGTGE